MRLRTLGRQAALAALGTGVPAVLWSVVASPVPRREIEPLTSPAVLAVTSERSRMAGLSTRARTRDPFRFARRPAAVAFSPEGVGPAADEQPRKPGLSLMGVVAGSDPTAVVEGFPGIEGSRVVRAGEVIGGLRVDRIAAGEVQLSGLDTVWVLRVAEPWRRSP